MKRKIFTGLLLTVCLVLLISGCATDSGEPVTPAPSPGQTPAATEPVAEPEPEPEVSFDREVITFIVPMSAGGGTDSSARLFAHFLEQELPGQPTVRVENMAGGGGAIGFNYLYTLAEKDLSIGASTAGVLQRWRLQQEGHDYDLSKMPVIGGQVGSRVAYMNAQAAERLGVESAEDLFNVPEGHEITFGQTRVGGAHSLMLAAIREEMGIPIYNIYGYGGMAEVDLAMISGETAASIDSAENYLSNIEPMVANGEVIPLFQIGVYEGGSFVRDPRVPDIPTISELYDIGNVQPSGVNDVLIDTLQKLIVYGTSFFLHPDTEPKVTQAYRDAIKRIITSEEFVKEGINRTGEEVKGFTGEQVEDGLQILFGLGPEIIGHFETLLDMERSQ